ncbi:metal-sensing transcriptional repressor [Desulfitobacterium chlororespirans]|uniref:DNA-binding transcriptional regulator, FrmR family n=1 Tax=Desulfitobacterium chlororespirans DSM 11544 TaxID=1121395 RepID=A0A1M7TVS0_9FIRM|nr:metal-sensing transcriptional repressor [Desulfitobacterium chlororespirans]SHN74801.1 DNA-binding transcriptional regulator, FrmR family [Desulfitobacterium chlororespirans DSM 11544]
MESKTHEHEHEHHHHSQTKAVINRISRVTGHMQSVKTMVEEGRDCSDILIQLSAIRSAINNIGRIILQDHIDHCVVDAVESGDKKVLEDLNNAIEKFLK